MSKKVYLAGPIRGLTYDAAEGWRAELRKEFYGRGIDAYSPLRGKDSLRNLGPLHGEYPNNGPMATGRGIAARDGWDVMTCDLMIVNAAGVAEVSGGTAWELGIAWALRKPVILITSDDNNPYLKRFPMADSINFRVQTLTEAVQVAEAVLLP